MTEGTHIFVLFVSSYGILYACFAVKFCNIHLQYSDWVFVYSSGTTIYWDFFLYYLKKQQKAALYINYDLFYDFYFALQLCL